MLGESKGIYCKMKFQVVSNIIIEIQFIFLSTLEMTCTKKIISGFDLTSVV
jgi:hypothetical protein